MAQIQKRYIKNQAIDETKILLSNSGTLNARNAANTADVPILQVNAVDAIVFSSVPQITADGANGNDLVRYSQLTTLVEGLKPKQAVAVASLANIDLTVAANPSPIDGYTLVDGDRILLKDQTAPAQNGIYVAVTAANPTTYVRSADFNAPSEIPGAYTIAEYGTISQGFVFVTTSAPTTIGTDPINFVCRPNPLQLTAGDMIGISAGAISVALSAVSGLQSTTPGVTGGTLEVKLEASNPSLKIDGTNALGVKLDAAGAIIKDASGIAVQLESSNPTLQISSNALGVKLDASGSIVTGAAGIGLGTNSVTNAQLAQAAALTLKGNNTGSTANVADLSVSAVQTLLSIPNTPWATYTPTITGFGTVTNSKGSFKKVGDSLFIKLFFTAGTVTATLASFSLPATFALSTDSTNKIPLSNTTSASGLKVGSYASNSASGTNFGNWYGSVVTAPATSTTLIYCGLSVTDRGNKLIPAGGNAIAETGCDFSLECEVILA